MTGEASLLGPFVMSALPPAVRACIGAPQWWRDELQGLHVMNGLDELVLPDRLDGTVHMMRDGVLADTGEVTIGCVLADGTETGVHATIMPGRRIVRTPVVPANAIIMRNC